MVYVSGGLYLKGPALSHEMQVSLEFRAPSLLL